MVRESPPAHQGRRRGGFALQCPRLTGSQPRPTGSQRFHSHAATLRAGPDPGEILMRSLRLWLFLTLVYCSLAFGHEGDTDGEGCHFDTETGEQHCH